MRLIFLGLFISAVAAVSTVEFVLVGESTVCLLVVPLYQYAPMEISLFFYF
jgi:hypothetical protein